MSKPVSISPELLAELEERAEIFAAPPFLGGVLPSPQMEIARLERRIAELEERVRELERKP